MKTSVNNRFSAVCSSPRLWVLASAAVIVVAGSAGCSDSEDTTATVRAPSTTTVTEAVTQPATSTQAAPAEPGAPSAEPASGPEGTPSSDQSCEVGGLSIAIDAAIAQIAPPVPGGRWVPTESNLGSCTSFGYVVLETEGGTVSSPYQLLLFHDSEFVGTGTACNLGYQHVTGAQDDQIDVTYRYIVGDEPNADPQGAVSVGYRWNGVGVDMIGELPAAVTGGRC